MADWSAIRSAIETWVASITGLPVYWRRRPRGWVSEEGGYVLLDTMSHVTRGTDQVVLEYDAAAATGSEYTHYQLGQRTFVLEIQVRTWRTSDDVDSLHYTSLVRDSLRLPSTAAAFAAVDVAIARAASEIRIDDTQDDRQMSVSQLDILINAISSRADTPTGYIETVEGDLEVPEGSSAWTGDFEV